MMELTREEFMGWALHVAALELASYRECSFDDSLDFIVAEALAVGLESNSGTQDQAVSEMLHHFDCVVEGQRRGTCGKPGVTPEPEKNVVKLSFEEYLVMQLGHMHFFKGLNPMEPFKLIVEWGKYTVERKVKTTHEDAVASAVDAVLNAVKDDYQRYLTPDESA